MTNDDDNDDSNGDDDEEGDKGAPLKFGGFNNQHYANEMEKEGGDPTINIIWKLERERGWRNDDDDDDDDRATMMFLEVGESKGRGTTREEVL